MAEKPKTYPQKIQELQQQLEDAITDREEAERMASFIPELQQEISDLKAEVERRDKADQQRMVSSKASTTDLLQRAESAEQGLRNLQTANQALNTENSALQQQLDLAGAERDKYRGKDDKINLLHEELKAANLRIASLNQQLKDKVAETDASDENLRTIIRALQKDREILNATTMELSQRVADKIVEIENLKTDFSDRITILYRQNQELKAKIEHFNALLSKAPDTLDQLRQSLAGS